jgi:hypothetical protein
VSRRWLAFERRWRNQICAAIVPRTGTDSLPGMAEIETSDTWDRLLGSAPFAFAMSLRVAVWALTVAPLVVLGQPRPFGRLASGDQDQVLARCFGARWPTLRILTGALRLAACLCYFSEPLVDSMVRTRG